MDYQKHMTNKAIIHTDSAPAAVGTYSQAVKVNNTVYLSGQIGLDPSNMTLVSDDFAEQTEQVFKNLLAVCQEAGGDFSNIVKFNFFLTDLSNFAILNEIMAKYVSEPYPARAAVGVSELPKGAIVEADAVMVL